MRRTLAALALLAALPIRAQGMEKHWYLDVHEFAPTLTGHAQGTTGGNKFDVDLGDDLGLGKDKTRLGFGVEYQGPRFGLAFSQDGESYKGLNRVTRPVTINGVTYNPSTLVSSTFKTVNNNLNWTIRLFTEPKYWFGIDLGVRATQVEISAVGDDTITGLHATADYKGTLPIPQIGPAAGFVADGGRVIGRIQWNYLTYKGCTYNHPTLDLRMFPLSWLGVLVFADDERFSMPLNSVKTGFDAGLDRKGIGLGLVAKF
jgi:hypothetical protein